MQNVTISVRTRQKVSQNDPINLKVKYSARNYHNPIYNPVYCVGSPASQTSLHGPIKITAKIIFIHKHPRLFPTPRFQSEIIGLFFSSKYITFQ